MSGFDLGAFQFQSSVRVTGISESQLIGGVNATIQGHGFGATQGTSKVYLSETFADITGNHEQTTIVSWSDTEIVLTLDVTGTSFTIVASDGFLSVDYGAHGSGRWSSTLAIPTVSSGPIYEELFPNWYDTNIGILDFYKDIGAGEVVANLKDNTSSYREWCWESASTPSAGYGPTAPPTGQTGYVYVETSSTAVSTDVFTVEAPSIFNSTGKETVISIDLWCDSSYGIITKIAIREVGDTGAWDETTVQTGSAGAAWVQRSATFTPAVDANYDVRIIFDLGGGTITNWQGDPAIGNISIAQSDLVASGVTGTLSTQESGSDTATLTGEVLVEGDLASTDGSDTSTMSGEVLVAGDLSSQESGNDTATFSGGGSISGDLTAQESGSDTANLSGEVLVEGALNSTESSSDTASFSGEVLVDGDFVLVGEGSDTATFSGEIPVEGDLTSSESGADTITMSGEVPITGTFSIVESGSDVISLNGGSIVVGNMSSVESGSDTLTMTGEVPAQGILSSIEAGSDTSIFSGELPISGTMNTVENGTDGVSVTGNVYITGTLFISEQPDTASMSGEVLVSGTLSVVESGSDSVLFSGLEVTRTISKIELEVLKAEVESLNILGKTQIVLYPI